MTIIQKGEPMDDLISRQAAIEAINGVLVEDDACKVWFRLAVKNLPSAQPEQRWIPCSERLPDAECGESDIVLATCGYMNVKDTSVRWIKTLYFNGGNWCYPTGETYEQKVYAWMPLPEPYKGGGVMLMLSLDDAVKVAKRLIEDGMDDDEIIRQELEQKCWLPPKTDEAAKRLNDLIFDVNPAEICSQIESDNLKNWCKIIQTEMKMAMVQLPCWGEGERNETD